MKKITKSWSKDYGSLKIFKDDIEEIVKIITSGLEQKQDSKGICNKFEFIADGFALDNISELKDLKGNYIRELEFNIGYPGLSLCLKPKWTSLRVHNSDNTELMGIAMRIDAVLQKRHRFIGYFNNPWGYFILGFLSIALMFLMGITLLINIYISAISGLTMILVWACMWDLEYHASTIYLCYSHNKSNFFARNKDAILVSAITAVFSIVGTLFVQAILSKSKDKAPQTTSQNVTKEVNEVTQKPAEK